MKLSYAAEQVYKLAFALCVKTYLDRATTKDGSEEQFAKERAERFWPLYVKEALYEELQRTKERLRLSADDNLKLFARVNELVQEKENRMNTYTVHARLEVRGFNSNIFFDQKGDSIMDALDKAQKMLTSNFDQSHRVVIWSIEETEEEEYEEEASSEEETSSETLGDILDGAKS